MEFTGDWGVTQGDLLSHTIFNSVMDLVALHWLSVIVKVEEEWGRRGQGVRHNNYLFYADDGMVAFLYEQCLQGCFITLLGLFNRVGLRNNVSNTVEMFCRTCHAAGTQSEAVYRTQMTREVSSYQE